MHDCGRVSIETSYDSVYYCHKYASAVERARRMFYKMTILPHTYHNSYIFRNSPLNSTKTHLLYKKNSQKHQLTLPHDCVPYNNHLE